MSATSPSCRLAAFALALLLPSIHAAPTPAAPATTELTITKYVAPVFPDFARMSGVLDGSTVVVFSHSLDGTISDALAIRHSHPAFAREAADAVRQWRVAPHRHDGQPCQLAHGVRFAFSATGAVNVASLPTARTAETAAEPATTFAAVDVHDLDTLPAARARPMPNLSSASLPHALPAALTVTFFIDPAGHVRVPSLGTAVTAEVGEAVLAALRHWRYDAPLKAGQPVSALHAVDLRLDRNSEPKKFAVAREFGNTSEP
jgi:hypothetical protein